MATIPPKVERLLLAESHNNQQIPPKFTRRIWRNQINIVLFHLGISGIYTQSSTWRSKSTDSIPAMQIDLVIDRSDHYVHLCEMKFSSSPFTISKEYEMRLRNRIGIFREQTKTKKTLFTTFVTTYGIKPSVNSGIVNQEITLDDLFE